MKIRIIIHQCLVIDSVDQNKIIMATSFTHSILSSHKKAPPTQLYASSESGSRKNEYFLAKNSQNEREFGNEYAGVLSNNKEFH